MLGGGTNPHTMVVLSNKPASDQTGKVKDLTRVVPVKGVATSPYSRPTALRKSRAPASKPRAALFADPALALRPPARPRRSIDYPKYKHSTIKSR